LTSKATEVERITENMELREKMRKAEHLSAMTRQEK